MLTTTNKYTLKINHKPAIIPRSFMMLLTIILISLAGNAQGFLKAAGKKIVNERGENVLLRGMGLGGWMVQEGYMLRINGAGQQHKIRERIAALLSPLQTHEFYDLWLANHTSKIDIDSMHAWGFNSVRLPMHYNLYTLPVEQEQVAGENTWLEKGFAITDSLLSWCKANQMYLVLDLHAAPGGQGNDLNISDRDPSKPSLWASVANQQKTIALWKKLAERYANEPWIGGYDILNETNFGFTDPEKDKNGLAEKKNEPLKRLLTDITTAIRSVDKKHLIIIEGNGWGNNYNGMLPVWDDNMALSFHKYWNNNDQQSIQNMLDTRDKYNIPIWLGETGENSNVWFTEAIGLLESNNIGWAWWPLKKVGANNPLEIRSNLNYDDLVDYWNGKGKQPKESNVYSGLLELATYARLETNVYHKDVIDAMMRQPFSDKAVPYNKTVIRSGSTLKAVEYDLGRNGIAYYDTDTADYHISGKAGMGNRGRTFRNDGVDIRKDSNRYESYYVSDTEPGEWLQYTVEVAKKGVYALQVEVASAASTGRMSIRSGSTLLLEEIKIPETGGLNKWQPVEVKKLALKKGIQVLRFYIEKGGFNFKSVRFIKVK